MKTFYTALLFFVTGLLACNNKPVTEAKIFERKKTDSNKLMIKYNYSVAGKAFVDSIIVENTVMNSDSILLEYNKNNPKDNNIKSIK